MRTNCLGSLRAALKDAGLDDRYNDIPAGMMAERLRPRPHIRPAQPSNPAKFVASSVPSKRPAGISSVSIWALILAFTLGLIPSLAIGAAFWLEKSRTMTAYPCSIWTAKAEPVASARVLFN